MLFQIEQTANSFTFRFVSMTDKQIEPLENISVPIDKFIIRSPGELRYERFALNNIVPNLKRILSIETIELFPFNLTPGGTFI